MITPGQALALPPGLDGSDVLVDGAGAAQEAIAAALSGIAGKGGRPGLLVPVGWTPRLPGVLTSARVLLVDVTAHGPGDAEQLAFLLKTELTAARAAGGPSLFVGIAGRPATLEALLARDVGPYADLLAWAGAGGNERTGHRVWRATGAAIPALASVEEARSAARQRGRALALARTGRD